jgi:hypothetical protein
MNTTRDQNAAAVLISLEAAAIWPAVMFVGCALMVAGTVLLLN